MEEGNSNSSYQLIVVMVHGKYCEVRLVTWVRLKIDAEISFVAAPDGASYAWPWSLEAQVTRHIGTVLDFILERNESAYSRVLI